VRARLLGHLQLRVLTVLHPTCSERVGALHVVTSDAESAVAVHSVLESLVRPLYSTPPAHGALELYCPFSTACLTKPLNLLVVLAGARVAAYVLGNAELSAVSRDGSEIFVLLPLSPTSRSGAPSSRGNGTSAAHAHSSPCSADCARHARELGSHHEPDWDVQFYWPHRGTEHPHGE